jgi:hypothetical protein
MSGEILEERTDPKTTTETLPSLDALRNAYQTGDHLPQGVKIFQEYSIRSKRIYGKGSMDLETPEHFGYVLPEVGSTD